LTATTLSDGTSVLLKAITCNDVGGVDTHTHIHIHTHTHILRQGADIDSHDLLDGMTVLLKMSTCHDVGGVDTHTHTCKHTQTHTHTCYGRVLILTATTPWMV